MTLRELTQELGLRAVCAPTDPELTVRRVYAGDLLSRAMSRIKQDDLWITIMTNRNVVAVAELTEAAAIVLAEGTELLPDALEAARENGTAVLCSELTVFELCAALAKLQGKTQ